MYNQPIMTEVKTASAVIENEPTLIYWIFIEVNALGTLSGIKIYDGTTAGGKEVARLVVGYNRVNSFFPPIRCDMGVYVEKGDKVVSYTIGYLPVKVAKGQEFPLHK